jgi:hypothetical protein
VITRECRITVDPARPKELAEILIALAENPGRWRSMGKAAKKRIKHCLEVRNAKYADDVYLQLLG